MNFVEHRKTPDRDSKYMGLAWIHASFSKDPSTQVGAQIVDSNNIPLGSGYNGPPRQINDSFSWTRSPSKDELSKYDMVIHAEMNAISHSIGDLKGSTLYVTAMPCMPCMLNIISCGIKKVVYFDYKSDSNSMLSGKCYNTKTMQLANRGGVELTRFEGDITWMLDWSQHMKELGIFKL